MRPHLPHAPSSAKGECLYNSSFYKSHFLGGCLELWHEWWVGELSEKQGMFFGFRCQYAGVHEAWVVPSWGQNWLQVIKTYLVRVILISGHWFHLHLLSESGNSALAKMHSLISCFQFSFCGVVAPSAGCWWNSELLFDSFLGLDLLCATVIWLEVFITAWSVFSVSVNRFEHDFPLSLTLVHADSRRYYSKSNSKSQNMRSELVLMEKGLKLNPKPSVISDIVIN